MIRLSTTFFSALSFALAGCAATTAQQPPREVAVPPTSATATRVLDHSAVERLLANKGVTLHWLDWNTRGTANARWEADTVRLTAAQAKSGVGRLFLDGVIEEIGSDYFTFRGTIRIEDAPDAGRRCEKTKSWHFAITQNRPYWRLREFEWCDGLTDYIDIYF